MAVDDLDYPIESLKISIEELEGLQITRLLSDRFRVRKWQYNNYLTGDYLTKRFKHDPPDLVHIISGARISGSAIEAARNAGSPVVVTLTEYYWICPRNTLHSNNGDFCLCISDIFL